MSKPENVRERAQKPKPKDPHLLREQAKPDESREATLARANTNPENLSASVLVASGLVLNTPVTELARELKKQTAIVNAGDMTRAENMLLAQAHTLDAMFANLTTRALSAKHLDHLEALMRLAFKAQTQCRATLQTLGDLKSPRQVAFVKQANIGQNVQVNNTHAHTEKKPGKAQNELLEADYVQRLDTRATGAAIGTDPQLEAVGKQHRAAE